MTDPPPAKAADPRLTFKVFLETVHPSVEKRVSGLCRQSRSGAIPVQCNLATPELRLHCPTCGGTRTFRSAPAGPVIRPTLREKVFLTYICGDCHREVKLFALLVALDEEGGGGGVCLKLGEKPAFGVPVPNRLLRLFGADRDNFIKGRQCENQGLGVGAFAYYRRVVENHRAEIFDEIVQVCQTIGAPLELIDELRAARDQVSFSDAIDKIKAGLPDGLLINGHNPLLALHAALSVGLHSETDEACLEAAHAVRLVLTDLAEKMAMLRQGDGELKAAVQLLLAKRSKAGSSG
jgi:hypothetical protein